MIPYFYALLIQRHGMISALMIYCRLMKDESFPEGEHSAILLTCVKR